MVIGELYRVTLDDLPVIDLLEWKGIYMQKHVNGLMINNGNVLFTFVYVYLGDYDGFERISSGRNICGMFLMKQYAKRVFHVLY